MKIHSRRNFIKGTGAFIATSALGCSTSNQQTDGSSEAGGSQAAKEETKEGSAPHYVVLIALRGGYDAVMSMDPKDQSKVGDKIDCGYRFEECKKGSTRLFGPLSAGLERHDADLCLIHGVRSDTTAHPDGLGMLFRGSKEWRSRGVADALGEALPKEKGVIPTMRLTSLSGYPLFDLGERPSWASLRTEAHKSRIESLFGSPGAKSAIAKSVGATGLVEQLLDQARDGSDALEQKLKSSLNEQLLLAFQAVKLDKARCLEMATRLNWFDSHSDNVRFQTDRQLEHFGDIATFIDLLKSTKNEHGTLFSQTTLAVYSEFGRFPKFNGELGKDHWPENSWILAGKGVKGGLTVGGTDDRYKGLDINWKTGQPAKDGRPIFIDDAFATVAKIAGADVTKLGYHADAPIDCILA